METTFIPRVLSKRPKVASSGQIVSVPQEDSGAVQVAPISNIRPDEKHPDVRGNTKGKKAQEGYLSDLEVLSLLELSLSDYALCVDIETRLFIKYSEDGYLPLEQIITRSPYFQQALSRSHTKHPVRLPPQISIIRAIRTSPMNELLDVRVLLSEPTPWPAGSSSSRGGEEGDDGGFEIRRKDWENIDQTLQGVTKEGWDTQSVYVENVPLHIRTIPKIHRFVTGLLCANAPNSAVSSKVNADDPSPLFSIQHIATHAGAHESGAQSYAKKDKCYGYAFITFKERRIGERLLSEWPWSFSESRDHYRAGKILAVSDEVTEALRYSFRTLSKSRWLQLKDEYLKQMTEALSQESALPLQAVPEECTRNSAQSKIVATPEPDPPTRIQTPPPPNYPIGCLLFVKNLHPETNKTTLRELFSAVLRDAPPKGQFSPIDYVDYTKKLDTCYLRLSDSSYSSMIQSYFASNLVYQSSGTDSAGNKATADTPSSRKLIQAEIVSGRKERIYWEKVPEKLRMSAIRKANTAAEKPLGGAEGANGQNDPKSRKRKK
ncbi:uncharacterized protein EI90DRAFT_3000472 [Cantharellus anzutake]|uniref:uncharacterized protein n=1 Tax=Cantharellus anzutake TaxID=1750568 RepID=UPI001909042F|nr:uncharacterized protein EI90DRAFT_3000472 [Cantharellus anzutake]KAF8324567.1 hypothetical protein EI90DRAFT_3000472 [Cantharellus anzutake]